MTQRHNPHTVRPTSPREAVSGADSTPILRTAKIIEDDDAQVVAPSALLPVSQPRLAPPQHKRTKIGYGLRDDFIRDFKQIALDEEKKIYEVMEEAFAFYLRHYQQSHPDFRLKSRLPEE